MFTRFVERLDALEYELNTHTTNLDSLPMVSVAQMKLILPIQFIIIHSIHNHAHSHNLNSLQPHYMTQYNLGSAVYLRNNQRHLAHFTRDNSKFQIDLRREIKTPRTTHSGVDIHRHLTYRHSKLVYTCVTL